MTDAAPTGNGVRDAELIACLARSWWLTQASWQILETAGRLGFLWCLADLAANLLTGAHASVLTSAAFAVIALLLRWYGQQRQAEHALAAGEQALSKLHGQSLHGAMAPRRCHPHGDRAGDSIVINQQLDRIAPYWQAFLPALMAAIWQPAVIIALVATADVLAALLLLACAPLIPGFAVLIGMGSGVIARQEHDRLQRLGSLFFDRLAALPTLRLMNATMSTQGHLNEAAQGLKDSSLRVLRVAFLSSAVLEFFAAVSIAALAMYIGLALLGAISWGQAAQMTLHSGLFILLLAPEFFAPLRTLAQRYHERSDARSAAVEPFNLKHACTDTPPGTTLDAPPTIELRSLSVAWPGSPDPVLRGLNLTIEAGQWITLFGASGCGKSTLANALAGQLDWRGDCIVNGERVTPDGLRARLAWVDQQPTLFNASLRENLSPGGQVIDPARLRWALEMTKLLALCDSLPYGLDTRLGEGAIQLSGGQTQRLAIARALLAGSHWFVLDEPTAQLDAPSEQALLSVLRQLAGTHTIVLFAHSHRARWAADRSLDLEQLHAR